MLASQTLKRCWEGGPPDRVNFFLLLRSAFNLTTLSFTRPPPPKKIKMPCLSIIAALVAETRATTDAARTWNRATGPDTGDAPRSGTRAAELMTTTDEGGTTAVTEGEDKTAMAATTMTGRDRTRGAGQLPPIREPI